MPAHAYKPEQRRLIDQVTEDVKRRLAKKPKRLAHSLSVARTAEELALRYGVDPFEATVAGLLHDWEKDRADTELFVPARDAGIDFGVDLSLVAPLIHGPLAAHELAGTYPWLSEEILHAIAVHTTAAPSMSPLDMVVFVADGIEPLRRPVPAIEEQRAMVGNASLTELFWKSFVDGIHYVLDTDRYLYPGTIDVYNQLRMTCTEH